MARPTRQWFDRASAADALACTQSDIDYLIIEDQLRYAVPLSAVLEAAGSFLALNESLPSEVLIRLNRLRRPDFLTCFDFTLSNKPAVIKPQTRFLYIPHSWLSFMYLTEEDDAEVRAHKLQLETGEPISLWLDSGRIHLWGVRLGALNEAGLLEKAVFSAEELQALGEGEAHREAKLEAPSVPIPVRFSPPEKADEAAREICDFANRYVEEFRKAPTASALASYMLQHGAGEIGFSKTDRDTYDLNGKRIKLRQLQERLRNYRSE